MILAAHQPNYLPNLGFFGKMAEADLFVVVSNVQFSKKDGWVRRHKIPAGATDLWLSIPVLGSSQTQKIRDVKIDNSKPWRRTHASSLQNTYRRTADPQLLGHFIDLYQQPWDRLVDLNMAVILKLKHMLGIPTPIIFDEEVTGEKQELIINICEKYKADTYLSGQGGKIYMTETYGQEMDAAGIQCAFVANNLTAEFPYTTLHYLFTEGLDAVRKRIGLTADRRELSPIHA